MSTPDAAPTTLSHPAAWWGLAGVFLLLGNAVVRLSPRALDLVGATLTPVQVVVLAGTLVFFAWTEGVQGFHRRFSPRVVARASHLHAAPTWVKVLAPMACMGLIWAARRRRIGSWILLTMIVTLIVAVRALPFPWREIVDAGVVVGLSVGSASILWHLALALRGRPTPIDPDLPDGGLSAA